MYFLSSLTNDFQRSGREDMESIAERLSELEDLYFPRALQSTATNPSQRKSILLDLLSRDIPVFLERYGSKLTFTELRQFDALNGNYEVSWHLNHLRSIMSPSSGELRTRSITVKNRRRAYLDKLILEGQYFSEDTMREREPYLHHEYVGKFQDPSWRSMARPGERWSETLMRRSEEAILVAKIRGEQQRLGVAERDWVGSDRNREEEEEEEEEEDTEENEAKDANGDAEHKESDAANDDQSTRAGHIVQAISAEELQDLMDQFTHLMQQRFLLGEDGEHLDYSKIDNDATLDDHWQREANYDAEEKYFEED